MNRRSSPDQFVTLDLRRRLKARTSAILLACFERRREYQPWIGSFFRSQPRIFLTWLLFRPLRHFCTIIFKPKYLNNTILPPLGLISLLLNTGVNSWLHLGMISSLRGIKELVDQVPTFHFA